ncbi:hypothetical protein CHINAEXTREME_04460 [Halobiforma lacisalsi AJ5]|uniref:DUF1917 domain-containing protein n=1 Tax=Natronobacterium lacisalsi AJ5 TaxID=358396 RepID=M0LMK2_NATLA|nr:putative phosphothreonine lyase domain-containg protein [Halobiforma lacisalsi]APW97068.1 hypothetical protein CHINAEXTREME_04460 [Halobiforma lacisalsi AJ5]EMA34787.1 hypothetical protein C445_07715 [Halobiforma lacisalsi AJ5]
MRSPLDITDEETYWLRSRDVSDAPAIGADAYFSTHDVPRASEVTADDLPPADSEAVAEIDREALETETTIGKWQVTGTGERIAELWPEFVADAEDGIIWAAKAMTTYGYDHLEMYDDYLLTVYTPNYFAKGDVDRVRDHIREEYGITKELYYKPDIYTRKGIVAESAAEFGLSVPARYVA